MRWLRGTARVISWLSLSVMVWGCGSDSFGGTGQGTLQLMRFETGADQQPDVVTATGAQIDVCLNLCLDGGGGGGTMIEPFFSTQAAAVVVNRGKSDMTVDRITISYLNSGLADSNSQIAGGFAIPGARCSSNSSAACAADFECGTGTCVTSETSLPFTLFSLDRKQLIGGPNCVNGFPAEVVQSFVTISGRDVTGERFTISGGISLELANFDNCEQGA